jgi:hypothetical protein
LIFLHRTSAGIFTTSDSCAVLLSNAGGSPWDLTATPIASFAGLRSAPLSLSSWRRR